MHVQLWVYSLRLCARTPNMYKNKVHVHMHTSYTFLYLLHT